MHEQSLMRGLLRQLEALASEQGARRITSIRLRLGALSHFSPEHFRDHFARVAPGSCAEHAELEITSSEDLHDPHAQDVLIESIEVELDDARGSDPP